MKGTVHEISRNGTWKSGGLSIRHRSNFGARSLIPFGLGTHVAYCIMIVHRLTKYFLSSTAV